MSEDVEFARRIVCVYSSSCSPATSPGKRQPSILNLIEKYQINNATRPSADTAMFNQASQMPLGVNTALCKCCRPHHKGVCSMSRPANRESMAKAPNLADRLWPLILAVFVVSLLPSECAKMSHNHLCGLCGSDTFACGSNVLALEDVSLSEPNNRSKPEVELQTITPPSLNDKVQQVLLKLNRHLQVFNSSNCTCIPLNWRCDGEPDCLDSSDEIGCDRATCSPNAEFSCATKSKCISKGLFCDGHNDCGDNSDEIDCSPRECDIEHETRCDNGRCIPSEWLCDQHDDCGDLSDERCVNPCAPNEFQCHSGGCIPYAYYCNNETDCSDMSDEINCQRISTHLSPIEGSHISCPSSHFMCHNGLCISDLYQCDGDNDCGDWSDEEGCDGRVKCRITEFLCNNGQCINQDWRCDGDFDCDDMSDEFNCPSQLCSKEEFRCRSGRCIRNSWKCDGDKDCDDNSDEEGCAYRTECTSGNFRCRDGTCVSLSHVCNGAPNCPDGSDEDTNSTCIANVVPCRENGLPCQHLCVSTTTGHYCACKEGYRKANDGRSCIDIDECQIGNLESQSFEYSLGMNRPKEHSLPNIQVCSQHCENSVPGFQCSCVSGYRLRADKKRCKAVQGPEAVLLVSSITEIRGFLLDAQTLSTAFLTQSEFSRAKSEDNNENFTPTDYKIIAMDFHYSKNLVFWTNIKSKKIFSALLELNQKSLILLNNPHQLPHLSILKVHKIRPIVESGLMSPNSLTVDWINDRVYWTDSGVSRIEYCSLDGSMRKVLFSLSIQKPTSVVVNPDQGTLYWADWGDPPRIESGFLDGSGRKILVSSLLTMPIGLVIDYPASKLYWTDIKQNMIECVNLDGSSRYTILHQNLNHPISLTVFEDNLYWTDLASNQIHMVSKLTGRNVTTLDIKERIFHYNSELHFEIKVFHALRQPNVNHNPCHSNPCSHLCLPNNISFKCSCPFGFSFEDSNKQKCKMDSDSLLLFTHRNDIRAISITKDKFVPESDVLYNDFNIDHVLPISHISFVVAFDYDPISSTIFWADLLNKSISRSQWTGKQQEVIISSSLEAPSGIAYDWAGGNLYWTDTGRNVIEVANVNGLFRSPVVWRSLDQPRDIVVDPSNSLMFWSQWSNQTANIERAGMDGSYRIILHSLNLTRPQGLAIDPPSKRIYWSDPSHAQIEVSFYDGSNRRVLVSQNIQHPFALTIDGDFIYWSDLQQRNVQQAHKLTGQMRTILFEGLDNLMDIAVFKHNATQPPAGSPLISQNACDKAQCSHLCLLSPHQPGYKCLCPTGIRLLPNGLTCAADMDKYLIITTRNAIKRISLETDYHFDVSIPLTERLSNALIADVHAMSNTVFWSDTNENIIFKANILSGKVQSVVKFGLISVNGLVVDNVGNKIYWTDAGRKRIEVANLDGTHRKVLINHDLDSPRAVVVNHKSGHMIWADWGSQVRIERSDMDGQRRALLVSKDLGWPNGITITENGRIIWADSKTHTIEMVDLNGANRRKLAENLPYPYGIAVIDDYLYWTDWHTKSIHRLSLYSGYEFEGIDHITPKIEIFAKSLSNLADIRAINRVEHDMSFTSQQNMCQVNNGGCSHLCLRNSAPGYSCHCPTGMALEKDSKTCKTHNAKQLLIACKTNLRRISLDSNDLNDVYLPIINLIDVVAVDYHFEKGQIFYVDSHFKEIRTLIMIRKNLSELVDLNSNFVVRTIVNSELSKPSSIVVDWIAHNLYWGDMERHRIEVARIDGSSRKVLIDLNLDQPQSLAILPNLGFLFWINTGYVQKIERAFLDGSGRTTLVDSDIGQLNGLTVDNDINSHDGIARVYWTDSLFQRIESVHLDGSNREVVISKGLTLPFGVAVMDDYVYWTDSYNKVIERANRWSGDQYELIADNLDGLREIKVMSNAKQNVYNFTIVDNFNHNENPCGLHNGACSHLCLFRPHGYICACPSFPQTSPCSTVPGEILPPQQSNFENHHDQDNFEYVSSGKALDNLFGNSSFIQPTISLSEDQISDFKIFDKEKEEYGNNVLNYSLSSSLCRHNDSLAKCNSSKFPIDDHIVQAAYAIALVLLCLVILVCGILTFVCKRKIMNESSKLAMTESPIVHQSNTNGRNNNEQANKSPGNKLVMVTDASIKANYDNFDSGLINDYVPPPPPPPRQMYSDNYDNGHSNQYNLYFSSNIKVPNMTPSRLSNSTENASRLVTSGSPQHFALVQGATCDTFNNRFKTINGQVKTLGRPVYGNKVQYSSHPMVNVNIDTFKLETDI